MKTIICVLALLVSTALTGCMSSSENARSFLDRVEFDEDEYGTFVMEGTLDLNPIPMITTNVHVKLEKHKDSSVSEQP